MTTRPISVSAEIVVETQKFLRAKGYEPPQGNEGVTLWIGVVATGAVDAIVIPVQETGALYFEVPLNERQRIARMLAGTGRAVLAQVHSHPERAWHSEVDDARALPRRVGSLSLVVPDQARRPDLFDGAELYVLESDSRWIRCSIDLIKVIGDGS